MHSDAWVNTHTQLYLHAHIDENIAGYPSQLSASLLEAYMCFMHAASWISSDILINARTLSYTRIRFNTMGMKKQLLYKNGWHRCDTDHERYTAFSLVCACVFVDPNADL